MKPREFAAVAAGSIALGPAAFATKAKSTVAPLSRVQIAPFSILDEGIERSLDTLKNDAAINALFLYGHDYYPGQDKPPNVMATDHGISLTQ